MKEYFFSADSLTEEIEGIVHPKRTPAKKKKETIPYTLPYCCPNEETRIKRLRYAMIAMQEWGWIEEPESADDFLDLFSGKARQCNIKWTGKSLAILTLLIKRLLEQPYMETKKGCSVSAIVKNQIGLCVFWTTSRDCPVSTIARARQRGKKIASILQSKR